MQRIRERCKAYIERQIVDGIWSGVEGILELFFFDHFVPELDLVFGLRQTSLGAVATTSLFGPRVARLEHGEVGLELLFVSLLDLVVEHEEFFHLVDLKLVAEEPLHDLKEKSSVFVVLHLTAQL